MKKYSFAINGMHGEHCINVIKKILTQQPGIQVVNVEQGMAEVELDESYTSKELVIAAIEKLGYKVLR